MCVLHADEGGDGAVGVVGVGGQQGQVEGAVGSVDQVVGLDTGDLQREAIFVFIHSSLVFKLINIDSSWQIQQGYDNRH